ncbi:hypothetical protein D3C72_2265320 [compost metagenome]
MFLGALHEDRDLLLDQDMTGIGPTGTAGIDEFPLLDDLRAELRRRLPVAFGE